MRLQNNIDEFVKNYFKTQRYKVRKVEGVVKRSEFVTLRNKRTGGFAFQKWLCSEESVKVGVIVHCGAGILHPL